MYKPSSTTRRTLLPVPTLVTVVEVPLSSAVPSPLSVKVAHEGFCLAVMVNWSLSASSHTILYMYSSFTIAISIGSETNTGAVLAVDTVIVNA